MGAGLATVPALAEGASRAGQQSLREPTGGNAGPLSQSAAAIKMGAHTSTAGHAPVRVVTTDVPDLAFTLEDGWKVFRLRAEVIRREILPGKTLDLWGFNGSAPGPTIQVTEGDRVRVILENRLPEPTSMHWHGFEDSIRFDGMPGVSQRAVPPGGTYTYEFHITQTGTFFYHSHLAMQEMVGMLGGFIMHPRQAHAPAVDYDFLVHLQEYAVLPNNTVPNSAEMEFNWLVLNGKSGPAPTPLVVRLGSRVRIRFVNLGMDHHPMHLHGHTFYVTGTEAGRIPETAWWPGNTVLVGVAQARDVEFLANNPGDWMLHCHLPHHMMNQMNSSTSRAFSGDTLTSNGMISAGANGAGMKHGNATEQGAMAGMMMSGMNRLEIAPNANEVHGFPQDAFMEGPLMNMDAMVDKPENFGLPPGWSENMQGMMTFVRVLPAEQYDEVMRRVAAHADGAKGHDDTPGMDHSMPAMDHAMPGMDHSMPGMDHAMPGMDHSTMPGMDHSKKPGMQMPAQDGGKR
ncbi:hypothetical protein GCM10022270_32230 [Terriglobus aquaticus]